MRNTHHRWTDITLKLTALLVLLAPVAGVAEDKSRLIVNVVGVAVKSKPSFATASNPSPDYPTYSSKWSFGGGFLFGIPIFNSLPGPLDSAYKIFRSLNLDIEIGALYFKRDYPKSSAGASIGVPNIGSSQTVLQFPALLRFGVPFGLSAGGGVYYGLNRTQSNGTSFKDSEFGGVASIQAFLGRRFGYGFLVDGRYTFSLSDVANSPGTKTTFTDFQILFGIRI